MDSLLQLLPEAEEECALSLAQFAVAESVFAIGVYNDAELSAGECGSVDKTNDLLVHVGDVCSMLKASKNITKKQREKERREVKEGY